VQQHFHGIERWLVLLIRVHADEVPLDGMVALPPPSFARAHVREWARELLLDLAWPKDLLKPLTGAVVTYADNAGVLDVRLVYEALGGVVYDVRHQAEWIRDRLQEGTYLAHPA
jgi:hypothetical protein